VLVATPLAVVVPILTIRLQVIRLPIVGGEILAGLAIGLRALNVLHPSLLLSFLSELGLLAAIFFVMVGTRFDLGFLLASPRTFQLVAPQTPAPPAVKMVRVRRFRVRSSLPVVLPSN
jgi:Kef-type K+ transport system membrane component KefB